jgi:hypothetical protein
MIKEELAELYSLKGFIESAVFQKYFCKPLREKQDSLQLNFFSDSLKDSWRKGGKYEGIEEFFEILKQIDCDIKNKQNDLEI